MPLQGQDDGAGTAQAFVEEFDEEFALEAVLKAGIGGIEVDGQGAFAPEVVGDVLVGGEQVLGPDPEAGDEGEQETLRVGVGKGAGFGGIGEEGWIAPEGRAVFAPETGVGPAGQGFAGVPFAFAEMQKAAGAETLEDTLQQVIAQRPLCGTVGGGVPLGGLHVVDGDEGWFPAHGQTHVAFPQAFLDAVAEGENAVPVGFRVGFGDAWVFVDAGDLVFKEKFGFADFGESLDGGGTLRIGGAGERNVAFAGEESGGGIETHPAGAGNEDFGPGVQVGEIGGGTGGAVQRFFVGRELHEVARNEAGGVAKVAQALGEQPCAVATGAAALAESFFTGLHAGFETDGVGDGAIDGLVEGDEPVDGAAVFGFGQGGDKGAEEGAVVGFFQIGQQIAAGGLRVHERNGFSVFFEKKVERVDCRQVGDDLHRDVEFVYALGEHDAGEIVAEGVLLPVDEMGIGRDFQRIGQHGRSAMRGGAQADDLRRQENRSIVGVAGMVEQGNVNGHTPCVVATTKRPTLKMTEMMITLR
jgi:hypothetical protein